jgi:hypothetical protein
MNETKHPLLEKQLIELPRNWKQWLDIWNATSDPLTMQSLLHHGPEMVGAKHSVLREKAVELYLRLATRFYDRRKLFNEACGEEPTIFTCPRHSLAKSAFQALLKWKFKKADSKDEPWNYFLYDQSGGDLMRELINFLGLEGFEIYTDKDELHSLLCSVRDRHKDILSEFCLGLAKAIIAPEFRGCQDEENRKEWLHIWQPYKRHALKILWYFDQLDFLIENRDQIDQNLVSMLQKLILSQQLKTSFFSPALRKPKSVEDILKNNQGVYESDKKLRKAACVYLGLTIK